MEDYGLTIWKMITVMLNVLRDAMEETDEE
jgi:hypothetical protein